MRHAAREEHSVPTPRKAGCAQGGRAPSEPPQLFAAPWPSVMNRGALKLARSDCGRGQWRRRAEQNSRPSQRVFFLFSYWHISRNVAPTREAMRVLQTFISGFERSYSRNLSCRNSVGNRILQDPKINFPCTETSFEFPSHDEPAEIQIFDGIIYFSLLGPNYDVSSIASLSPPLMAWLRRKRLFISAQLF